MTSAFHEGLEQQREAAEADDMPPGDASPRETLEWQLRKGVLDQAAYDAIIANNPDMK